MEMHQLRYFVAVAEAGSFSRAAERCHVSQPSLSQQIIKLEGELGRSLFDRAGRRVLLTEAGRMLLDHARSILMTAENATHQLKEAGGDGIGRLAVGVIPTIAPYLLPAVIAAFTRTRPKIELVIQEDYTQRVVAGLCDGSLDIGIAAMPINNDQLVVEPLGIDPLLVVFPSRHRLAKKRKVSFAELRSEPFVLINDLHCLGEQVTSFCRSHEIEPRVVCLSSQISTVQALVALGQGVSLLPEMARNADTSRRRVYAELAEQPARTIVAMRHRHRYQTTQAREFIDIVKRQLASP
jgi:LysR family hydrogen peroxide-inducible transcriptional activator